MSLAASVGTLGCAGILGLEESTVIDAGADSTVDSATVDATEDTFVATDTFVPPDTFVAADTAIADTADTAVPATTSVSVFFAAPDQAKSYLCLTVWNSDAMGMPDGSFGPYGTGTGFAYPSVYRLPSDATAALATKRIAFIALATDPGTADPDACKRLFKDTMDAGGSNRIVILPIGTVKAGDAHAIALTGCESSGSTLNGACGPSGANLKMSQFKLDAGSPASGKLGIQVLDLSSFDETMSPGPPNLKTVDAYVNSYDATKTKKSEDKVANALTALSAPTRTDIAPPPGETPLLMLYPPGSSTCASFVPEMPPPMSCQVAPIDLRNPLLTAQSAFPGAAFAAGQSLVVAFTGTPRGGMPPNLYAMIGRIR